MPPAPRISADLIIELDSGEIVLVRRKNPPPGWAIPGGFLEHGESLEQCALREAREETGLDVVLLGQLGAWSDPGRDPRGQTVTVVFVGRAGGTPRGGDDAAEARAFALDALPAELAFDHRAILEHYRAARGRAVPPGTSGCYLRKP